MLEEFVEYGLIKILFIDLIISEVIKYFWNFDVE